MDHPEFFPFLLEIRLQLKNAAGAVCGHERGPAGQDLLSFILPEFCRDFRVFEREYAAKAAACVRLFLEFRLESQLFQELAGLVLELQVVQIMAGVMVRTRESNSKIKSLTGLRSNLHALSLRGVLARSGLSGIVTILGIPSYTLAYRHIPRDNLQITDKTDYYFIFRRLGETAVLDPESVALSAELQARSGGQYYPLRGVDIN